MNTIRFDKDLQVPVVVMPKKNTCDIFVPDLNVTIHGRDYVEAYANASLNVSAIYYYNHEHNLRMELSTTYAEAEKIANKCRKGSFATFIGLTA